MVLAKDVRHVCVTTADFLFVDGEMSIVTGDEEGIIRMYEYNPNGKLCNWFFPLFFLIANL